MGAERLRATPVLLGLARTQPLLLSISTLSVLTHYLTVLAPGLILQAYFDDLTGRQPAGLGPAALIALLVAVAVAQGLQGIGSAAEPIVRIATSVLMRRNLLAAALNRSHAASLPGSSGEAIGRLRDDVLDVSTAVTYSLDPLGAALMVGGAFWVLARTSLLVTAVVAVPSVAAMLLVNTLRRRIVSVREAAQQSGADVTGMISETFGALATIKGGGAEERVSERFVARCDVRLHAVQRDVVLSQVIDSLSQNLATIATGVVLLLVPRVLGRGSFTIGDFALFVSYLAQLATITGYVGQYARIYRQLLVSLRRLRPLLFGSSAAELVERHSLRPAGSPAWTDRDREGLPFRDLRVRGLTRVHAHGGGIRDVDLDLAAGTFTVVTGPVGAGKTTLLRTLLGLQPAEAGAITWNGELVRRPDRWFVPPRCAFTPQLPSLFTRSVEENILLGQRGGRERAAAAARTAVLDRDLAALPAGIETAVGPRGVRLSGGQVQRVAAARMLARGAALLVFDDLSSALDTITEAELWRRLREDHPAATILAVSHRPAAFELADQVVHLEHGRIRPGAG
ncbi:MAG: ABC transporter ATP-binding protein [Candidatus Dormiibacterota bacterium]